MFDGHLWSGLLPRTPEEALLRTLAYMSAEDADRVAANLRNMPSWTPFYNARGVYSLAAGKVEDDIWRRLPEGDQVVRMGDDAFLDDDFARRQWPDPEEWRLEHV